MYSLYCNVIVINNYSIDILENYINLCLFNTMLHNKNYESCVRVCLKRLKAFLQNEHTAQTNTRTVIRVNANDTTETIISKTGCPVAMTAGVTITKNTVRLLPSFDTIGPMLARLTLWLCGVVAAGLAGVSAMKPDGRT